MKKNMLASALVAALVASLAGGTFAVAKTLMRSSDIADGTIQSRDIKKGTIALNRLSKGSQTLVRRSGKNGADGKNGANGGNGQNGANGPAGQNGGQGPSGAGAPADQGSGNWGVVDRNTIGSPTSDLRAGPFSGTTVKPPLGTGSLGLVVGSATEKSAYGNEVDFRGKTVAGLTDVGFRVFATGEDFSDNVAPAAPGANNMPSIAFEIDPHVTGHSHFSTLGFIPANSTANQWSPYIDATGAAAGKWTLSGSNYNGTACSINTSAGCSLAEVKDYLATNNDGGGVAVMANAMITKGRDHAFQGAVDGLRVNNDVFDFEEDGVFTRIP